MTTDDPNDKPQPPQPPNILLISFAVMLAFGTFGTWKYIERHSTSYNDEDKQFVADGAKGMTWSVLKKTEPDLYLVTCKAGSPDGCDAYHGETQCTQSLPILCLRKNGSPQPKDLETDQYSQWAGAEIDASIEVMGTQLTSRETADAICSRLGSDWRMAEFHDGWAWGFWAKGRNIPDTRHFWVAIDGQESNCWDH